MAKLDVISSSLVPMATTVIPMTKLNLTPWDLQLLLLDPIQKGILFHNPKSHDQTINIIDHLKTTFSRALSFFPPLAGRLAAAVTGDDTTVYFVDCNNQGAEFTHARACNVSVFDISEARYTPEIVSSFFPLDGVRNHQGVSNPLLGVQITVLADGLFIGCTANHAVVDGASFWHFINSWSEISRGFDQISRPPVFDRDFPGWENRAVPISGIDKNPSHNSSGPPLLERVFHFSKESVGKLKSKANFEAGSDVISSFQSLVIHLWRGVARCRSRSITRRREISLVLAIGTRARIPLREAYFGNAICLCRFGICETDLLLGDGLGRVGLKINGFISEQASRAAVLGFLEEWVKNPAPVRRGFSDFIISSSPRHDVYGNDFGWGRPIAVRSGRAQKCDGKMTFFPAAEDGGVDVEVCLAPETMKALEDDAGFREAVTF